MARTSCDCEWDFFIAHASSDKGTAEALYQHLQQNARVFMDSQSLRLGDDWDIELREAQQKSLVTVVLISANAEAAYYQREEIAAAIALARTDTGHRVVPVYLDEKAALSDSVPYGLRLKHGIALSGSVGLDELHVALLDLRDELKRQERAQAQSLSRSSILAVSEEQGDEFAVSIREHMAHLNRRVDRLTQDQYRIIRQLQGFRQVRISGCAGSGKTLVAVEKAIRLSNAGLKTLFLCHSPLLAEHVSSMSQGSGVQVATLGHWIASLAGDQRENTAAPWSNFEEPDAELLERAFDHAAARTCCYDAIIVDEAQDWRDEWWVVVEATLTDPKLGILYIFHDDQQALLPYRSSYPIDQPVFDLSRNCRNAGRIYEAMQCLHKNAPVPEAELKDLGDALLLLYDHGSELEVIRDAVSFGQREVDEDSLVVLLGGSCTFETSPFCGKTIALSEQLDWQHEVRREFQLVCRTYDPRGVMIPLGGKEEIFESLEGLSDQPLPTPADVDLIRGVAHGFRLREDLRRALRNDPVRRQGLAWTMRDGQLRLWRSSKATVWASEIIVFFQNENWDAALPSPKQIRFEKHDDRKEQTSIPVYHVSEFKGLEADVVLFFVQGSAINPEQEFYVGISRARLILAMMVDSRAAALLPPSLREFEWKTPVSAGAA